MSDEEKDQQVQQDGVGASKQPIFNLVPAVAAIAGLFVAIHAAQTLVLNDSARSELLVWFAFIPYRLIEIAGSPGGIWPLFWTPVTHAFLHAGWDHVLLNTVWFVIFATPVAQRYGGTRMILLFLGGAIAGAVAFAASTLPFEQFAFLVGASGGVSGLTGAAIRFMFQPVRFGVNRQTGERIVLGRDLASVADVFRHSTARLFTIVWIVLNAGVPLLPLLMPGMQVEVAWQAHLGGFLFGFFAVPLCERKR